MKGARNKNEMHLFVLIIWCIKQSKCDNYSTLIGNTTESELTKDSTTAQPGTAPIDGFPNIVGYYCYQCLPPNLVKNKTLACTLDKTNDFNGYIAECKYQLNGKNIPTANPKPVRGCYFGITKDDKVFKGCTFQSIAVDKKLYDYEYEVDFTRMENYTGEHGSKHIFTFREFTVCQEHRCNNNGNRVFFKISCSYLHVVFLAMFCILPLRSNKISNAT